MDCGTTISYGKITLKNVLTESVTSTVVRDSTGVDPIGMKTQVVCVADAHTSEANLHGVGVQWELGTSGLSAGIRELLDLMVMPRQQFTMTVGAVKLFEVVPGEASRCEKVPGKAISIDISHGPTCEVSIMAIAGTSTAKCRFRFEFTIPICSSAEYGAREIDDVLNFRYWIADDIDCRDWTTIRMYRGTLRLKRKTNVSPHVLARNFAMPPINSRFRRERIHFDESPNGLEIGFTIIDREVYAQAPWPATSWSGTYSVSVPQGDVTAVSELTFRLSADVRVPKRNLFRLAQLIIDTKLHLKESVTGDAFNVLTQTWQESLENNEINVHIAVRHTGEKLFAKNLFEGAAFELGNPLDECKPPLLTGGPDPYTAYDKTRVIAPGPSALATTFLCALQTPCCTEVLKCGSPEEDAKYTCSITYGQSICKTPECAKEAYNDTSLEDTATSKREPGTLPKWDALYSESHRKKGYQWYRLTNHYHNDTGWRAFPIGKQCSGSVYSTQQTVAFAQLHCAVGIREVRIHACRLDTWPDIPQLEHWIDHNGVKYVLKDATIDPCPVSLTADGRHLLHECYATLYYYMSSPLSVEFPVGTLPYISSSALANEAKVVTAVPFVDPYGILDGSA